ncbi:MAG: hypothetical protein ACK5HY_03040 [Parahaliea sp.]
MPRTPTPPSLQQRLDEAPAGATLTLPPGEYPYGLVIRKPLTLNMEGVHLQGVAWGKGILIVEKVDGPVVINDFHGDGIAARATSGNLAGVRISGPDFHVTLNRAHIRGSAMGVLSDNRGGTLRVRDSTVEDIGAQNSGQNLSHVIYAGIIDRLEITRSDIGASNNQGHLVKSRARQTLIRHSRVRGGVSRHSRVIDIPCGGELEVLDSHLQRSPRADNLDLIGIGLEISAGCRGREGKSSVIIEDSILELGPTAGGEPGQQPVYLFRWVTPQDQLRVRNTTFVLAGHPLRWQMSLVGPSITVPDRSNHFVEAADKPLE